MKAFFAKWWPSLAHIAGTAIVFLNPAVLAFAKSHPAQGSAVMLVWGFLLHWATSPKS